MYDSRRKAAGYNTLSELYHYCNINNKQVDLSLVGPIEVTCNAGEVIFIPHGWWHLAVNLETTIAITQNYCNDCNLLDIFNFWLTDIHPHNKVLYDELIKQMNTHYPGKIKQLRQDKQERTDKLKQNNVKTKKKSLWDTLKE